MKLKFLLLTILINTVLIAQEITAPEPDFEGQIVFINNQNESIDLEMQTCSAKTGQSVGRMVSGIGKVKARLIAKGKQSDVQIKKKEKLNFVYNNGDNSILPNKVIRLLQFQPTKKNREYLIASSSNVSGQTSSTVLDLIKYKAKKFGNNSYLITIDNLEVGEYAFFLGIEKSNDAFLFSVVQ